MTELILELETEYKRTLEVISRSDPSSEECRQAIQKAGELNRQLIALIEADEASFTKGEELKVKKAEAKTNKVLGWAKVGGELFLGVAGLFAARRCFNDGLTFEQTGAFCSKAAQNVSGIFRMFRK